MSELSDAQDEVTYLRNQLKDREMIILSLRNAYASQSEAVTAAGIYYRTTEAELKRLRDLCDLAGIDWGN